MRRLIEIDDAAAVSSSLTISVSDVLLFAATGSRILSGSEHIEIMGPFVRSVIGDDGQVYSPAGPPNSVEVVARKPGNAVIEVMTGDPWHGSRTVKLGVVIVA
jgi:hypothetical protein